jgi:dienelactone hydrolase
MKAHTVLLLLLASAVSLPAKVVLEPVAYEHDGTKLQGWLAYDDAKPAATKLPGVLIVPEWWGVNEYVKGRARQVAELGYVALVADMYGGGIATTDPKKANELASPFYGKPLMAQRARAGLDQLLKSDRVDASRVAAMGYCFGGAAVQALAYTGADLAGIVSFHGSLIPVSPAAAAATKARFLICHGADDPFTSKEALDTYLKSLADSKIDYEFIAFGHAVHAFTNRDADQAAAAGLKGVGYNAAADRRSWSAMKDFFTEIFGSE